MKGILERVAKHSASVRYTDFQPLTKSEFFAFRLADKLGDVMAARHYVELADRYSEAQLLTAYRRTKGKSPLLGLARNFHTELERIADHHVNGATGKCLAAIQIAKRAAAIAIFKDDHLAYSPIVRQLPTDKDKAVASLVSFIRWMLDKCPFDAAALEVVGNGDGRRVAMTEAVRSMLLGEAASIWDVPQEEIMRAFGSPPPRFRKDVRTIAASIWPGVNGSYGAPLILDALALGLFCQTEYLFNL